MRRIGTWNGIGSNPRLGYQRVFVLRPQRRSRTRQVSGFFLLLPIPNFSSEKEIVD